MLHDAGPLAQCFPACVAPVGDLPQVHLSEMDELTALAEGFPTLITPAGLLLTVKLLVLDEVSTVPEGFPTVTTKMQFCPKRNFLIFFNY